MHLKGIEEVVAAGLPQWSGGSESAGCGSAGLHFGEEAARATALGRQSSGTASGLCQSAASEGSLWPRPAAEEGRVDRAELRALLRYGRNETNASTRTPKHSQATADSRWGIQSESNFSLALGLGYSTGAEKSSVLVSLCAAFSVPSPFRGLESQKTLCFITTIRSAEKSSLSQIQTSPLSKMRFRHGLLRGPRSSHSSLEC